MIKVIIKLNLALSISILSTLAIAAGSSSSNYTQTVSSFNNGSSLIQSNAYKNQISAGQLSIVGKSNSTNYTSSFGFFSVQENLQIKIISAIYNAQTGQLLITGANFSAINGTTNDIDASTLTFTGENNQTYTLTDTPDVEIDSATQFTLTLSDIDQINTEGLLNKNGTNSDDNTVYNIAVANGFNGSNAFADNSNNPITVSNTQVPTISSVNYNSNTGVISVVGTNFVKKSGADNDIDISALSFKGSGGTTQALSNTTDIEISSSTNFSITLDSSDKTLIDTLLNNGDNSYSLTLADNWLTGIADSVDLSDSTGTNISLTKTTPTNHPTNISVSTNGSGTLTTTWTEPTTGTLPDGYLIVCSTTTITAPTNGVSPTEDSDCSDGSGVQHIAAGSTSTTWTGLDTNTNYQFKIYPYSNSGASIDYKTDATPQALAVTESALTPEISISNIRSNAVVLAIETGDTSPRSDDDTDFGTGATTVTKTFRITNTGQAPLTLSSSPAIRLLGLNTGDFTITQPTNSSIAVGTSEDFSIAYTPATGISTATVVIANNDSDEGTYSFNIQGGENSNPIPPRAEKLRAFVDGTTTLLRKFYNSGGDVKFAFDIVDSDGAGVDGADYGYTWTSSNNSLNTLLSGAGGTFSEGTVTSNAIDISSLSAGDYPISVSVRDSSFTTDANYKSTIEFVLKIVTTAVSTGTDNIDTDGDGVVDANDDEPNNANNVPARLTNGANYVSKVPTGYRVTLGTTASAAERTGLKVSTTDLSDHGNAGGSASNTALSSKTVDHVFDYIVEGVAVPNDASTGNNVTIVLPLETALTATSTFHKYDATGGWTDFTIDANNKIEWANWDGGTGVCPDPDSASYNNTDSQVDKTCLRITIQDGGENDQDDTVNGTIVDPFGIATPTAVVSSGGGGSSSGGSSNSCSSFGSVTSSTPTEATGSCHFINYFVLALEPALDIDATVDYQTRDGSAKAGEDYTATSGTVTMKAGQTQLLIPVTILADNIIEDDESFDLVLSNPTGASFPVGTSEIVTTHTILNSDTSYAVAPTGVTAQQQTTEGSTNHTNYFQLALDKAYDHDIIVSYQTRDGTATAGEDYIATSRKAKIAAGETKIMLGVEIIADNIKEEDETFSLVISNPIGEGFPEGVSEIIATHTILDDD